MLTVPEARPTRSGAGKLVARLEGGRSRVVGARAESPLRWVFPSFPGARGAAACIVTFGGGLVDGDHIDIDVVVEAGASLVLFTQASSKVFRGRSSQHLRAVVDGTLVLLPDPVAAFAGASYTQRVEVALGPTGGCVLLDAMTSGRPSFGERWAMDRLDLRTSVRCEGRPIVVDALVLDSADGPIAARATAGASGFDAFATLIAAGESVRPIATAIATVPIAPPTAELAVAASSLPRARAGAAGAIARVAARRPEIALAEIRRRLRNLPDIGAVDPWNCRH